MWSGVWVRNLSVDTEPQASKMAEAYQEPKEI